ncbi:MAG: oligosaccharide flippase family protein, partial [Deltaproteobacteria bacterium]|nr:oligosaccharide flippase family protein [Deltaproteobacteria bacterium]
MRFSTRVVLNSIFNLGSMTVTTLVGFFLIPFIIGHLDKPAYGVWTLTASIFSYTGILALGLNSSINRIIPVNLVRKDYGGIRDAMSTGFVFYLMMSLVIMAATAIITIFFPYMFNVKEELIHASRVSVAVTGIGFAVFFPMSLFSAVLSGIQRYDIIASIGTVASLLKAALVVALFNAGFGLISLVVISAAVQIAEISIHKFFASRLCPEAEIRLSNASRAAFKEMIGYSLNTFLYASGSLLLFQSSSLVIGLLLGTSAVAEYSVPVTLVSILNAVIMSLTNVLKPAASHLDAASDLENLRRIYIRSAKYAWMLIFPAVYALAVFSRPLITGWVGEKFEHVSDILVILSISQGFYVGQMSTFFIIVGIGRHRFFGATILITAVFNIALSFVLIKFLDLGLYGAAIGFAAPLFIASAVFIPLHACSVMSVPFPEMLRESFIKPLILSTPYLIYLVVVRRLYYPDNLPIAAVEVCAGGI